ncbi:MAG: glycoside hydrolase family 88 protein [Oscillospiraceae bacterium]|nr:glycoside hydrolase family 88 protein [Oscillospiraceae bacterium]
MYSENDKKFAAEFLAKVEKKLTAIAPKIGADFPDTNRKTGEYMTKDCNPLAWTAGYWPGMMWLMYIKTGNEMFRKIAEECEEKMDVGFGPRFKDLHHDVGFMWSLTSVANYKITGNEMARIRASHAASVLASRFNPTANVIKAWPWGMRLWAIIDCMMNIPILEWASKYGTEPDPRFAAIARVHADTVIKDFIRPDGSVHHIVHYDTENGEILDYPYGQGYASGSSWSRGQSWAVYGMAVAYINSGKQEYLDAAKRVAHYFMTNVEHGKLPLLDFRAPADPVYYDSGAAAITACGLIELAKLVPEYEAPMYERAAIELLRACEEHCNWDEDVMWILGMGAGAYHTPECTHAPFVWNDYYLVEALMKLHGNDGKFITHDEEIEEEK